MNSFAATLLDVPEPEQPTAATPQAKLLSSLAKPVDNDPGELLKSRYICKGATLLVCGPTGIGKSALAMQCMVLWALGRETFGIRPTRPLKSLLIQAENDEGDLAEMRDGVIAGLNLTPVPAEQATSNVVVFREDEKTSTRFFAATVRPLLTEHHPDLLWIDPALAYLGGETGSQKDVGAFLRNQLNPLLREFDCACVILHHTNKPPKGKEKAEWQAGDFAYLGSGSAEWGNVPRAVLALRSIGSHEVFELRAGKRGSRLGWTNKDGEKSFVRYLAHSKEPGVICWQEIDPDDVKQGGRPKDCSEDDLFALLPPEGLTTTEWCHEAARECGVKERTFHNTKKALENAGKVLKSKIDRKWKPIRK